MQEIYRSAFRLVFSGYLFVVLAWIIKGWSPFLTLLSWAFYVVLIFGVVVALVYYEIHIAPHNEIENEH